MVNNNLFRDEEQCRLTLFDVEQPVWGSRVEVAAGSKKLNRERRSS